MLVEGKTRLSHFFISAKFMQQLWFLTLIIGLLWNESQCQSEQTLIMTIKYRYGLGFNVNSTQFPVRARLISSDINGINGVEGLVKKVQCLKPNPRNCQGWLLCMKSTCAYKQPLPHLNNFVYIICQWPDGSRIQVILQESPRQLTNLLSNLSKHNTSEEWEMNVTFEISRPNPGGGNNNHPSVFSPTGLFGMIFLSACVVLMLGFCTIWFGVFYYRQFKERQMKKKLRLAIARSVQQMLDRSPIIIYDPINQENDHKDNDPMCAICLESFKAKENIRKLQCSHYFHVTCIDPWLLAHQSCPLCNRNILSGSISSISAQVMPPANENSNAREIIADHQVVVNDNPTFQSDNAHF